MKAIKYLGFAGIGILAAIGLVALGYLVLSFSAKLDNAQYRDILATPENPVVSPSGKYRLLVAETFDGVIHFKRFEIVKADGSTIFICREGFGSHHATLFLWDNEDRVWVYSGDVGTAYWTRVRDDLWVKHYYGDENVPAPEFLKKARPEYHKK